MARIVPTAGTQAFDSTTRRNLARALRHEMGDFLQKVYATIAIVQDRLPAGSDLEKDLLIRLRMRAGECKDLLDTVQDFLSPLNLEADPTDLGQLAGALVAEARIRWPELEVVCETTTDVSVQADSGLLAKAGRALLANACEAARRRVTFHTLATPDDKHVEWKVIDDGQGVSDAVAGQLFTPFFSSRAGHAGLGLALAHKIVAQHGGRINAENLLEGGFQVGVTFPRGLVDASKA